MHSPPFMTACGACCGDCAPQISDAVAVSEHMLEMRETRQHKRRGPFPGSVATCTVHTFLPGPDIAQQPSIGG